MTIPIVFKLSDIPTVLSIAILITFLCICAIKFAFKSSLGSCWLLVHQFLSLGSLAFTAFSIFMMQFCPQKFTEHVPGYLILFLGWPVSLHKVVWNVGFVAWATFVILTLGTQVLMMRYFFVGRGIGSFSDFLYK